MLGGGAVVAFGSSGTAQAAVEADVSPLDIPRATHSGEDSTVAGVDIHVDGSYQYTTDAADKIIRTTFWLSVVPCGRLRVSVRGRT